MTQRVTPGTCVHREEPREEASGGGHLLAKEREDAGETSLAGTLTLGIQSPEHKKRGFSGSMPHPQPVVFVMVA